MRWVIERFDRFAIVVAVAVAVGLATVVAPYVAQAQQPSARERAQARAAFQRGERAFDAGRTEEALDDFRRAFRLAPHDAVRFNIAVCLERLGRFIEAAQEYDAAAVSEMLDAPTLQRAREQAARVRLSTATLVVSGSPAGADVLVDDERRCALPCRVQVDPGERRVVVRSSDGEASRTLTVARGAEARVRLAVERTPPSGGGGGGGGTGGSGGGGGDGDGGDGDGDGEPEDEASGWRGPGALTWIGGGVAVAGAIGVVAFGLQASGLHDDFQRTPTADIASDGETARDLTNVSIIVGAVGLAAVALDLFVLSRSGGDDEEEPAVSATPTGVRVRF